MRWVDVCCLVLIHVPGIKLLASSTSAVSFERYQSVRKCGPVCCRSRALRSTFERILLHLPAGDYKELGLY